MKKDSIYNVQFSTCIHPYHIDIPVKAHSENHAISIARRICKFGSVKEVTNAGRGTGYVGRRANKPAIATESNTKDLAWLNE